MDKRDEYLEDIKGLIEKHGFVIQNVINSFSYTVGLGPSYELYFPIPIGNGVLGAIAHEIVGKKLVGTEDVLTLDGFTVEDKPMRYRIIEVSESEKEYLFHTEMNVNTALGYEKPESLYLVQVPDENNILPDEPGYNWVPQSINIILH